MTMLAFIKKWWFVLFYLGIYLTAINLVVLNRFWQFEGLYYDHGIYDSALWQASQFKIPLIDHLESAPIRQLGDHFTPTMYLLTPVYWLTSAYETTLIVQNLLVTIGAFVVFLIAKEKIKNRLMVFAIVFGFTLFIGLQNALISNFHTDLIAIPLLALTCLFLEKKRWLLYFLFLLLTLGTKQYFAGIGLGLGIFLLFRKNWWVGVATIAISVFYYFLTIKVFIPVIGQRPYWYPLTTYSPIESFKQFFWPPIKVETMLVSMLTFGGLPLAAIGFLPTILQDFVTRFVLNSGPARWDLGMHYNSTLSVLLAYGAILGSTTLAKFKKYQKLISLHAVLIILMVIYLHQFKFHGPLGLVINPTFYKHTANFGFMRTFIGNIPRDGLVMTQNNIAPYLTHSHTTMLLRDNYGDFMPEVIAIDTRGGQNPANYWPVTQSGFKVFQQRVATDSGYLLSPLSTGEQLIYLRN